MSNINLAYCKNERCICYKLLKQMPYGIYICTLQLLEFEQNIVFFLSYIHHNISAFTPTCLAHTVSIQTLFCRPDEYSNMQYFIYVDPWNMHIFLPINS
jgi:hypothetical protein